MIRQNNPFSGDLFLQIISYENLLSSWREFRNGKRNKLDVQRFELAIENNLFSLHEKLSTKFYRHSDYTAFYIVDPKLRYIHKACVRDRILHHAVYRILYSLFDKGFIFDSYSCRVGKGTHKAVNRLHDFARAVSKSYTKSCFILKCDIRKFFDSVDHHILFQLIKKKIDDEDCLLLLNEIIESFAFYGKKVQLGLFKGLDSARERASRLRSRQERERERERERVEISAPARLKVFQLAT